VSLLILNENTKAIAPLWQNGTGGPHTRFSLCGESGCATPTSYRVLYPSPILGKGGIVTLLLGDTAAEPVRFAEVAAVVRSIRQSPPRSLAQGGLRTEPQAEILSLSNVLRAKPRGKPKEPCDKLHNSVIPTGTDHREAMICGVEGPCVSNFPTKENSKSIGCPTSRDFRDVEPDQENEGPLRSGIDFVLRARPHLSSVCTI
jgi:hypothetical protein